MHFKTKLCNRDPLLNKIIGKYTKSDINENREKLVELCNLHNLWITNFVTHKPTNQTTWTSLAPYKNVNNSKTKLLQKNPYCNQIDYILVRNWNDKNNWFEINNQQDHHVTPQTSYKENNYCIQKTLLEMQDTTNRL